MNARPLLVARPLLRRPWAPNHLSECHGCTCCAPRVRRPLRGCITLAFQGWVGLPPARLASHAPCPSIGAVLDARGAWLLPLPISRPWTYAWQHLDTSAAGNAGGGGASWRAGCGALGLGAGLQAAHRAGSWPDAAQQKAERHQPHAGARILIGLGSLLAPPWLGRRMAPPHPPAAPSRWSRTPPPAGYRVPRIDCSAAACPRSARRLIGLTRTPAPRVPCTAGTFPSASAPRAHLLARPATAQSGGPRAALLQRERHFCTHRLAHAKAHGLNLGACSARVEGQGGGKS